MTATGASDILLVEDSPDVAESYPRGANSYIVKPVNFDQFANVITQLGMYWMLMNQAPPATP
jgi:two-component system, response regulator